MEIVNIHKALYDQDPPEANHFASAGQRRSNAALLRNAGQFEEAVKLRKASQNKDPSEQMQPLLASLAKYKNALSRAGREDDAQAIALDVLDIHRQAFIRDPRTHWKTAAEALRLHANRLSDGSSEGVIRVRT